MHDPPHEAARLTAAALDDPAGKGVDDVRPIRDEIDRLVRALLHELGVEPRDGC